MKMRFSITDKDLKNLTPNMRKLIRGLAINNISYILVSLLLALVVFYFNVVYGVIFLAIALIVGGSDLWNMFKILWVFKKVEK